MVKPTKIPTSYAYSTLTNLDRGYDGNTPDIDITDIREVSSDNEALVQVSKLKKFFGDNKSFKEFKRNINVPQTAWHDAALANRSARLYANKFLIEKVGNVKYSRKSSPKTYAALSDSDFSDASSDESIISIKPYDDNEKDLNLPLPTCQAIHRVCKNYDANRRYLPYKLDYSDKKNYIFDVSYE